MSSKRIIASTLTYNRKDFLLRHVRGMVSQTKQPYTLLIVDNDSQDGTGQALQAQGWLGEELTPPSGAKALFKGDVDGMPLVYVCMDHNTGCAAGVAFGLTYATQVLGADWCWIMDDDCVPRPDALAKLDVYLDEPGISCLGSLPLNGVGHPLYTHRSFYNPKKLYPGFSIALPSECYSSGRVEEITLSDFDGSLVNAEALEKSGPPDGKLFFFYEVQDFFIRLGRQGKMLLVTDSIVDHYVNNSINKGTIHCRSLFGSKNLPTLPRLQREYFRWRNTIIVGRRYQITRGRLYLAVAKLFYKRFRHILFYADHKILRLRILLHATYSGLFDVFDNSYPRRVLESVVSPKVGGDGKVLVHNH